ncbi:hypothetical protein EV143_102485 [Flavobacterium chryseum]|nr:hypothetical protein EV143_102485 [Flavobacterium sp. P3160]
MKIINGTNHSVWKIDSGQYFPEVSTHLLLKGDKKCSQVYFYILNTT